ncbi:prostaglandin reductase 1-like [Babylonia areolata]|uniref:prostaglandin reductase 1-like n=1 Tax=Babylonia areolata TaxID=304850 RepID=UPI003FD3770F
MAQAENSAKVWKLQVQDFDGDPKASDFTQVEEWLPATLQAGEVFLEAMFISVDPYMRVELEKLGPNREMFGDQIARVKSSNNTAFPAGSVVVANVGWRTRTVVNADKQGTFGPMVRLLPDLGSLSPSLGLSCLGMTGLTAYFGLLHRGQPQAGQTVLVSGAAGAVGSVVGQLAQIQGCTVIGSAGSQQKCSWLKEAGFDHVFNYKETAVDVALKEVAPDGIDLYFDNVGGDFTYSVIAKHMKFEGRVVMCGAISTYSCPDPMIRDWTLYAVEKQLTIVGSNVISFAQHYPEAIGQLLQWVKQGKLKYRETITEGFENTPEAFASLFKGANIGKAVVKI